jgi:hypothetical protein
LADLEDIVGRSVVSFLLSASLLAVVTATPLVAAAEPIEITVASTGDETLIAVFPALPGTNDWGSDLIPAHILGPGESADVVWEDFRPGTCVYDFWGVTLGEDSYLRGANVCANPTLLFP